MFENLFAVLLLAGGTMIGAAMSYVGLRGLALRRPFVIRGYAFTSVFAAGVAVIAIPLVIAFSPWRDGSWSVLLTWPSAMLGLAALAVVRLQGYIGFGMGAETLRETLTASLRSLEIEHVESLSSIELPRLGLKLDVSVDDVMGTARLRAPGPEGRKLLAALANEMNRRFRATRPAMAFVSCASYAAFGTALLAVVGFFLFAR